MKEYSDKQIEDYILGKLRGSSLEGFEEAMLESKELSETVEHRRIEWEMQELLAEQKLRAQIREHFDSSAPKSNTIKSRLYGLLAIVGVGFAALFFYKMSKKTTPASQKNPIKSATINPADTLKSTIPTLTDTLQAERNKVQKEKKNPKIQQKPQKPQKPQRKAKQIPIAEAKTPNWKNIALSHYALPQSLSGVRGQSTATALDSARIALSEKKYAESISILQTLPEDEQQEALSIRAHAHFLVGQYAAAANDFKALELGGIYNREAEWYGLLSLIAQQDYLEGGLLKKIGEIANNKNHPYHQQAVNLLNTAQ